MTATDWAKLESLFSEAAAKPLEHRRSFLQQACAGDAPLLQRLESMLESDHRAGLLDSPLAPSHEESTVPPYLPAPSAPLDTLIGRKIGQYSIRRVIACGGMGTVYEAQQEHPCRLVALKVLNSALPSRAMLRRFQIEADILGRLQHPAIAQVYEAGVFGENLLSGGQPFYAMELIHGEPVTDGANHHHLPIRERLAIFQKICAGVTHAHEKGVIHRDLKPANILLDPNRQPKILDFGIARVTTALGSGLSALVQDESFRTQNSELRTQTVAGQLIGTVPYMSPEQVSGDPTTIDARSDMYALGVICYELLAGRLPQDLHGQSLPEAIRIIRSDDPAPLASINKIYRGDLNTIVGKALEKDPARRYQTVAEFSADLQRYLDDQPIAARAPSAVYQLQKFARRHKGLVAGVVMVFLVLVLGMISTTWQWARATQQRDEADAARGLAKLAEDHANARLEQTLTMAGEMMDFAEHELADLIGGTRVREHLALAALRGFNESLSAGHPGSPSRDSRFGEPGYQQPNADSRFDAYALAYAHQRVGEVQLTLGQSAAALASHQQALAIRERQAEAEPQNVQYLRALAVGHWNVAQALAVLGRFDEAQEHHRQSLEIHQTIDRLQVAAATGDFSNHYLGANYRRIAEVQAMTGDHAAALENYRRSLHHFELMVAADPRNMPSQQGLAMALRGLGESLAATGEAIEARTALQQSLRLIDEITDESGPPQLWNGTQRTESLMALAKINLSLDGRAKALEESQQARALAQTLSDGDPINFQSRHLVARALASLADVQRQTGQADQAAATLAAAVELFEALAKHDPDNALVRRDLQRSKRPNV